MDAAPPMHPDARALADRLRLLPHPEGGFYREVFRSARRVSTPRGARSALTVIHYLLPAGAYSALHRIEADEVWTHAGGDPLDVHLLDGAGGHEYFRLGAGGPTEVVVPAGTWQGARPRGERFALATCAVAPGFEFSDFELADERLLAGTGRELAGLVRSLLRRPG